MLVLTRKLNESIVIGDITITIVKIGGAQIRLGIEAPKEVIVLRKEVKERMELEDRK